jgi:hypothetical protein
MKVMVIVKATKNSEAGVMPARTCSSAMGKYNEELVKAGIMLAGDGLHPSTAGKRVQFSRGQAHRRRRPVRRDEGAHRGLLDLAGAVDGRGARVGAKLPRSDAGGGRRARDPPRLRGSKTSARRSRTRFASARSGCAPRSRSRTADDRRSDATRGRTRLCVPRGHPRAGLAPSPGSASQCLARRGHPRGDRVDLCTKCGSVFVRRPLGSLLQSP